jgi:hypothetical protein
LAGGGFASAESGDPRLPDPIRMASSSSSSEHGIASGFDAPPAITMVEHQPSTYRRTVAGLLHRMGSLATTLAERLEA